MAGGRRPRMANGRPCALTESTAHPAMLLILTIWVLASCVLAVPIGRCIRRNRRWSWPRSGKNQVAGSNRDGRPRSPAD